MDDGAIRAALDRHWAASDADDFNVEHAIYREDAVLEYPQSGERIVGRERIQMSRTAQPNRKRFTERRVVGAGSLWVTEYVLAYDGRPSYTVSIMESWTGRSPARPSMSATRSSRGRPVHDGSSAWRKPWRERRAG